MIRLAGSHPLASAARKGMALLLACLLLLGLVLAASHQWHAKLHQGDEGGPHHCLPCLLSTGGASAAVTLVFLPAPAFLPLFRVKHTPAVYQPAIPGGSPGGRAPPVPF